MSMYRRPELYDAIYSFKDYKAEAERLHEIIQANKRSTGNKLLDVACGTGKHIEQLKSNYECEGLDISWQLLKAARERNPECNFLEGDMLKFELGHWFDVVLCMFSAIGHVITFEALKSAVMRLAIHTAPGGVVIVEPFVFPENWKEGHIGMNTVDQPEYKVVRMNVTRREGSVAILDFHYMIATPAGIETFSERVDAGLFSPAEYRVAFEEAGLETTFDEKGLIGRGLFIGIRP